MLLHEMSKMPLCLREIFCFVALPLSNTRTSLHFLHSAGTLKPAETPIMSVNRSSVHAVHAHICILEHLFGVQGGAISSAACQGPIKGRQQEEELGWCLAAARNQH